MLVRLFGSNFGPFRDGFDLSLEAAPLPSDEGVGYSELEVEGEDAPLRLLRLAAIYGPNASGKSTIVRAASSLHFLARDSGPRLGPDDALGWYHPFRLDPAMRTAPCELGCEVLVDRRVFTYEIGFTGERITSERIVERREGGDREWLTRDESGRIRVNSDAMGAALSIDLSEVTRANASALSIAAQLNQTPLLPLHAALGRSLRTLDTHDHGLLLHRTIHRLHTNVDLRRWAVDRLLRVADLGIVGIETREEPILPEVRDRVARMLDGRAELTVPDTEVAVEFLHRSEVGETAIGLGDQSEGTRRMLALAWPWHDVIHKGMTLFADELSASLHPTLLAALLAAMNGGAPDARRPSQLIFTTHDPNPLEDVLRRDQVYFTEKNDAGVARLYGLSEFSERQNVNIRKRYLEGRYGAIPRHPDFSGLTEPAGDA